VKNEATVVGGIRCELALAVRPDLAREGSFQIVEVGLGAAATAAAVDSSLVHHGLS